MMDIKLQINSVIKMDGSLYRIIDIAEDSVLLINIKKNSFDMQRIQLDCFYAMIEQRLINKIDYEEPQPPIERLTEKDKDDLYSRQKAIENTLVKLYPSWEDLQRKTTKQYLLTLMDEMEMSKTSVLKLIRRYLQSGRQLSSLIDGRKSVIVKNTDPDRAYGVRGPKIGGEKSSTVLNDKVLEAHFEEFYQEFLLSKEKGGTIQASYDHMIGKYYTDRERTEEGISVKVKAKEDRPSYGRFLRYCNSRLGNVTVRQAKKGRRTVRNDERLLLGNSQTDCDYPGQMLEIDEVEIDMVNVSEADDRKIVGRAVMYMAIDVYSCCIVACWVDYHNNSFIGITNLFLTLVEEHNVQTKPYGITIPKELFPSEFLPAEVRVDQGAEYVSKDFRRMGKELGFSIVLVPPGAGSLKGLVEQSFHQFQEFLRTEAKGNGIILKRVESKHYETACTDIHDMRSIAYQFVAYYNRHRRDGYPYSREMIESGIMPTPAGIWNYGLEHCAKPRMITEGIRKQIKFAMLKDDKTFRLSRAGITYKGLYFYESFPWLLTAMMRVENKTVKLDGIRYDPRSTNAVYSMQDGIVYEIPINEKRNEQKSFKNLTWEQYENINTAKKKKLADYEDEDLTVRIQTRETMGNTLEAAKKMQGKGKNQKADIRKERREERARISQKDSIFAENQADALEVVESENNLKKRDNKMIDLPVNGDWSDMDAFFDPE